LKLKLLLFLIAGVFMSLPATAGAYERVRRNVEIEWEVVDAATLYEVQVTRREDKKKKPMRFKVKTPKWSATIKPGLYDMQIRSYDDRGVPGDWSPASELLVKLPAVIAQNPNAGQVIQAKDESAQKLTFKWLPVPGARKYKIKANAVNGLWSSEKEVEGTTWPVNAPVGQVIHWQVTALDEKNDDGESWESPQIFELRGPPLRKPSIEAPISAYLREIKWAAPSHAKHYSYDLKYFNAKTKKWEAVESKPEHSNNILPLDTSRPTGKYRLQVQAHGEHRAPSALVKLDFDMMGNFRDPASLDNAILRESITKPTHFYTIASYLITQVQYEAHDYDQKARSTFDALGGTGRLGGGYQDPESKWGGFGIVDLSGFTIEGQNFQFASVEAHLTRKLEFGQGGLLLFASGLFSKELPVVLGSKEDGFRGVGKVRSLGPHAGFTYWMPLSSRFGMQLNARAYYTLLGSAPNGGALQQALSYQYGLLGSYRLNKAWMGYAGYANRTDNAAYESNPSDPMSFARPGQVNDVLLQGHYLNLILEYSF